MRVETIGNATLYLGDCREILPGLGGVDAIISDPPYGISYVKGRGGRQGAYRGRPAEQSRHIEPIIGDNVPFSPLHLLAFDNVLIWGANHYCHELPRGKGRWLAWNKLDKIETFDDFSDVEFAWHSLGRASRVCNFMWKGGIACVKAGEENGRRYHPTMKPVGLMVWCIEQAGSPAYICDPYMGSGSTGLACVRLNKRFVGIECDPVHYETALRRIEAAQRQSDLFVEPPPRANVSAPADLFQESA